MKMSGEANSSARLPRRYALAALSCSTSLGPAASGSCSMVWDIRNGAPAGPAGVRRATANQALATGAGTNERGHPLPTRRGRARPAGDEERLALPETRRARPVSRLSPETRGATEAAAQRVRTHGPTMPPAAVG